MGFQSLHFYFWNGEHCCILEKYLVTTWVVWDHSESSRRRHKRKPKSYLGTDVTLPVSSQKPVLVTINLFPEKAEFVSWLFCLITIWEHGVLQIQLGLTEQGWNFFVFCYCRMRSQSLCCLTESWLMCHVGKYLLPPLPLHGGGHTTTLSPSHLCIWLHHNQSHTIPLKSARFGYIRTSPTLSPSDLPDLVTL